MPDRSPVAIPIFRCLPFAKRPEKNPFVDRMLAVAPAPCLATAAAGFEIGRMNRKDAPTKGGEGLDSKNGTDEERYGLSCDTAHTRLPRS
jgi:hypothetical protein